MSFRDTILMFGMFVSISVKSQVNKHFEVGISGGYGVYSGSLFVNYQFSRILSAGCEYSLDKYQGRGIGFTATYYYPMQRSRIKPLIALSFMRTFGRTISYDKNTDITSDISVFKTKDANYFVPTAGLRYDWVGPDSGRGGFLSFVLKVGYKINSLNPGVSFVSGPPDPERLKKIDRYINNSVVASLAIVLNFVKKHKNDSYQNL